MGEILEQLKEDGLAENTIVFFFSDHGSGMPRHKRALLDSGMHVPLLSVFLKMAASCPIATREKKSGIISFVDFGPTVLDLQTLQFPMQGKPFEPILQQIGNMFMDIGTGWSQLGILPVQSGMKNTCTSGTTCPILI